MEATQTIKPKCIEGATGYSGIKNVNICDAWEIFAGNLFKNERLQPKMGLAIVTRMLKPESLTHM